LQDLGWAISTRRSYKLIEEDSAK
jgi:5'(3')-deoxyribonucleotidase